MSEKPKPRELNRHERRRRQAMARKDYRMKRLNRNLPTMATPANARELTDQILPFMVAAMAARGPLIRRELEAYVGGEPTAGHLVDALMTVAAKLEESIQDPQPVAFVEHAAALLMLARDLAYLQGRIKPRPEDAPS